MCSDEMEIVGYRQYCPPGVQRVIASGTSAWIGEVDESTVLKYPLTPGGDRSRLELEYEILCKVGKHPRIIGFKHLSADGLYLERATNGTLHSFILSNHTTIFPQQRLAWCRDAAEAVAYVHSRRVIHCDIQPTNLLLDENLCLKLSDFQETIYQKPARSFWKAEVPSRAGSSALEMTRSMLMSRRICLRLAVRYISL